MSVIRCSLRGRNSKVNHLFKYRMTLVSKVLALITFLVTIIPIVVFGRFENEFLRLNIIFSSLIFSYFANEHYLIRLIVT